jgi:hypothetical protein
MEGSEDALKIQLRHDVQLDSIIGGVFVSRVAEQALRFVHRESWRTAADEPSLGSPLMRTTSERSATTLYELDGALLLFAVSACHVFAAAAANDHSAVEAVFLRLHDLLPPPDPSSKHEVPVTFWTYGPQGPRQSWRSIAVPGWDEIETNYRGGTKAELAALMHSFRPAHGGQLLLWHGSPGTGKTFALRSLAWEWRDWCEFNYVVDPDAFFGQHADYLMSVLLEEGDMPGMVMRHMRRSGGWAGFAAVSSGIVLADEVEVDEEEEHEPPWRLLVLEDAGELIQADARAAAGQGLSRFLNVVDGLIGQGLRILVLVTTNEEIRRLHPAVARPGRCAANIEFGQLSPEEATAWLLAHGVDAPEARSATLASLFAQLEGRDPEDVRLVGFSDS